MQEYNTACDAVQDMIKPNLSEEQRDTIVARVRQILPDADNIQFNWDAENEYYVLRVDRDGDELGTTTFGFETSSSGPS